ncbi:hypothetical protein GJR99_17025 [Haloferax sp. MBLA0078]|uniref:Uncharacterized protein n=1 Tax=Haloferax marinum TaxID=2666143 RepID=A0A6A8GB86_9EURY|nr:hypothetical protein Hfx1150_17025 [Haloferax sp. CBA1150]MRW98271.1 hypothetical protein [Haloferax marinum]
MNRRRIVLTDTWPVEDERDENRYPFHVSTVRKRINPVSDDVHAIQQCHLTQAVLPLPITERQMWIFSIQDHLVDVQRSNLRRP